MHTGAPRVPGLGNITTPHHTNDHGTLIVCSVAGDVGVCMQPMQLLHRRHMQQLTSFSHILRGTLIEADALEGVEEAAAAV